MAAERRHLASLLADWELHRHERAVVEHVGVRSIATTYGELLTLTGRFSAELRARAIAPGERVLLWADNGAMWMAAFFGCVLRGVLVVPLDAAGSPEFARRVLREVTPRLVVADVARLALLGEPAERSLALERMREGLPAAPDLEVDPSLGPETPFQIVFTSGTTSEPKGVVHSHRNVLASVAPIEREMRKYLRYERPFHPLRFLHTLPLSHVFGQFMGLWLPPLLGAEVHFVDSAEPTKLVTTARRERVSVLVAVPRLLELLRAHLLQRLPGLQAQIEASQGLPAWGRWWRFRAVHRMLGLKFWALICGGATLPEELERFWNGLGFALVQGYGMTETAALVTLNHPLKVGRGTLGKALPGREVRLTADGEIEVRGDMLAAGSWRGGRFEPRTEEWLATGDLGQKAESGELRFTGRKGDVLVTAAGLNVFPADLEAALRAQPGVRAAAVVACEGARGPEPVAVVVFEDGAGEWTELLEHANGQLAGYQQMRRLLRWPEPLLPYTPTGKLLRRQVAAWACGQVAAATGQVGNGGDRLVELLAAVAGEVPARTDNGARLVEDLHLDSLGRVQLQSELASRFGVELSDDEMAELSTLGQLRATLHLPAMADQMVEVDRTPEGVRAELPARAAPRVSYPRWPWSWPVRGVRAVFVECVLRPLVWALAAPQVARAEEEWPQEPMLLVANHVSTFDLPLILYALPGKGRRWLATAMSAEVLAELRHGQGAGPRWLRLLARPAAWLLPALLNVFPLPRLRGFRSSFAHAGEALDRGYSVLVFPEGRRSYTGELAAFRPGIGLLVQAARVPVLPIALQGVGTAGATGRWLHAGRVTVRFGAAMRFQPGMKPEEITRQLEMALRALEPS